MKIICTDPEPTDSSSDEEYNLRQLRYLAHDQDFDVGADFFTQSLTGEELGKHNSSTLGTEECVSNRNIPSSSAGEPLDNSSQKSCLSERKKLEKPSGMKLSNVMKKKQEEKQKILALISSCKHEVKSTEKSRCLNTNNKTGDDKLKRGRRKGFKRRGVGSRIYRGVSQRPGNKWTAEINFGSRIGRLWLGTYHSAEAAARAYDKAARYANGSRAITNFPLEELERVPRGMPCTEEISHPDIDSSSLDPVPTQRKSAHYSSCSSSLKPVGYQLRSRCHCSCSSYLQPKVDQWKSADYGSSLEHELMPSQIQELQSDQPQQIRELNVNEPKSGNLQGNYNEYEYSHLDPLELHDGDIVNEFESRHFCSQDDYTFDLSFTEVDPSAEIDYSNYDPFNIDRDAIGDMNLDAEPDFIFPTS